MKVKNRHVSSALAAAFAAVLLPLSPAATALAQAQDLSSQLPPASIDHLGRPAPHILQQLRDFAGQPFVPEPTRTMILAAVGFFAGGGEGGVPLPENGPVFAQFGWPTVAARCIGGQLDATGTAIAVPGPAEIPAPGAGAGETVFLFTALGTGPLASEQHTAMRVDWVNINTWQRGSTPLVFNGVNPDGPATVSGTAQTGHGTVLAWLSGGVSVDGVDGAPASTCNFAPTAASFVV